ncbi:glutamate racemase [Tessaracoccus bendigoensis DSM 12906]|uniref:Glutamate racemase n=1 Tax=Tessaracoccus bendigoensis DSM 12906 TaxID=1123357 RepID=A0A1M6H0Y5_9ACTN|nr:glutamate racemase [Tessaracoccus bendigoensis]SHJ15784.1 glutamate racemase [Tessaracoccus bendigoensis DSM 12906]
MTELLDRPIGVFDSGFGGLTVLRSLVEQLPNEDFLYLGDTARAPYGPRAIAEVRKFALEGLDYLVGRGVKALVIACNSASSAVLRDARERYDVPITEVILPAASRAVAATRNGRVGVVATESTVNSRSYDDAFAIAPRITLTAKACPRFVEFVEAGVTGGEELLQVAEDYLEPIKKARADTLILGCTHYPLLAGVIGYVLGNSVTLVSSAEACAQSTYSQLTQADLLRHQPREATRTFLTTGDATDFRGIGRRLLGGFVTNATTVVIDGKESGDVPESDL